MKCKPLIGSSPCPAQFGLHQALEAKEGVKVREEASTSASVTFQVHRCSFLHVWTCYRLLDFHKEGNFGAHAVLTQPFIVKAVHT